VRRKIKQENSSPEIDTKAAVNCLTQKPFYRSNNTGTNSESSTPVISIHCHEVISFLNNF